MNGCAERGVCVYVKVLIACCPFAFQVARYNISYAFSHANYPWAAPAGNVQTGLVVGQ